MQYGTTTFRQRTVFVNSLVKDGTPTSRLCFLNISICFYLLTQTTIKEAVKKQRLQFLLKKIKM